MPAIFLLLLSEPKNLFLQGSWIRTRTRYSNFGHRYLMSSRNLTDWCFVVGTSITTVIDPGTGLRVMRERAKSAPRYSLMTNLGIGTPREEPVALLALGLPVGHPGLL